MAKEEICIIIIPNDFPKENDDDDQKENENNKYKKSQDVKKVNEKKTGKKNEEAEPNRSKVNKTTQNDHSENNVERDTSSSSAGQHSNEYPCPVCDQSLANRFRNHTIPKLKLREPIWIPTDKGKNLCIICFTEQGPQSDEILDELRRAEIGIRPGTQVFTLPLNCALGVEKLVDQQETSKKKASDDADIEESVDEEEKTDGTEMTPLASITGSSNKFVESIREHITMHKVVGSMEEKSLLTFDYVFFCALASMIAALGLLENNTVILVASMLVSPLMGPIMGFVIGIRIQQKKLWISGLKTESVGIAVSVLTGFFFGLCTTWSETKWGSSESFPTDEMRIRGDYRRLWLGAIVALPSGAAGALSVLSGKVSSLVGVAISASLLPPAVNAGLLFSYSLLANSRSTIGVHSTIEANSSDTFHSLQNFVNCTPFVDNDYLPLYSCDMAREAAQLAVYSFIITLINIICIGLMVVVILFIKKVVPLVSDEDITRPWHSKETKEHSQSDDTVRHGIDGQNSRELNEIRKTNEDAGRSLKQRKERDD